MMLFQLITSAMAGVIVYSVLYALCRLLGYRLVMRIERINDDTRSFLTDDERRTIDAGRQEPHL